MKRILVFCFIAALFVNVACNNEDVFPNHRLHVKSFAVSLDNTTKTLEDSKFNDATVFVYQIDGNTGLSKLYDKKFSTQSQFTFELTFSEDTQYSYEMKAYANMGDLEEEPAEILFSNETNEGVQFHGELSPIVENSLSDITIEMKRYGQKVTIAQITIENNKYTGTSEVLFKSIYLANVAEKFGGEACYNLDGYHVDSHLDDLLYRSVDVSLSNGTYLERDYELYGYTTESTCVVLESEMNGKTMYYHFPISVGHNINAVYEIVICQRGSETPLGDTMIDNYKSGDGTLNIVNYETLMHEVTIGDNGLPDIVIVIRPKGSDE